jgi:hypothetical protein
MQGVLSRTRTARLGLVFVCVALASSAAESSPIEYQLALFGDRTGTGTILIDPAGALPNGSNLFVPMSLIVDLQIDLGQAHYSLADHQPVLSGAGDEGVELSASYEFLRFLDTSAGQGIFFSPVFQGSPALNLDESNPQVWRGRDVDGQAIEGTFTIQVVPEPSTLLLVCAGLFILTRRNRASRLHPLQENRRPASR